MNVDKKITEITAYYLWEKAGCPIGQDENFWFQAEKLFNEEFLFFPYVPIGPQYTIDLEKREIYITNEDEARKLSLGW